MEWERSKLGPVHIHLGQLLKVIGIRPMAPVLSIGPLEGIRARNVKFFGKERNY